MKKILYISIIVLSAVISFQTNETFAQTDSLIAEAEVTQTRGLSKKIIPSSSSSSEVVEVEASVEKGEASYYADKFHGRLTSSGEVFNNTELTAAHNSLPFGTIVKVTNLANQTSVIVKINDRGPFKPGRVIDLSRAAAEKINLVKTGTAQVKVEIMKEKAAIAPQKATAANTVKTEENKVGTGLFKIQMQTSEENKGFGIQIGSYSDFKSLFHAIESLNKKGIANVMVHSGVIGDAPIYRLVVGPYLQKTEADAQLVKIKALGENGLVLTLANLK